MRGDAWTADVVLNNGATVHVRPIASDDSLALRRFHRSQSAESQYRRYFTPKPDLTDKELERFTNVDLVDRGALVVEDGEDFIGWGSYERLSGRDDAEVAFHVDDAYLGQGIATLLLEHLSAMARAAGIERFVAEVLAENRAMAQVFSHSGRAIEQHLASGVIDFVWSLESTPDYLQTVSRRETVADARSVARFLLPRSVAVIGASDRPGSVGRALLENALASGPRLSVVAVNPAHQELLGVPCFASVDDVADDVGLAIVAVPEKSLREVLRACARRRVRGAIVVTEVSDSFPTAEVVADARRYGMRIVGPGSMGAITASLPLHAHVASTAIPVGSLAISLHSGSLGASVLARAAQLGLGIASFVSLGDKADVSANDLLQFWDGDASVRVIALYTESFGNPRRFFRIARRVAVSRPIVAVRPGGDEFDDALYQQAGIIRVATVREMFDIARVLALNRLPGGPRVAVVSNSSSPAHLLLTGLESVGLEAVGPAAGGASWQRIAWSADAVLRC